MARVILNTYFSEPAHGATEENIAIVGQVWVTIFYPPTLKGLSLIKHEYISPIFEEPIDELECTVQVDNEGGTCRRFMDAK